MRTAVIVVSGVLLSFLIGGVLTSVLLPNAGQLIVTMWNTPASSSRWDELWTQWQQAGRTITYLIKPLVGVALGVFVGLLQKHRVVLVATTCLVPDFLVGFLADRARYWSHSLFGICMYLFNHSLPLVTAAIVAYILHRLMAKPRAHNEQVA